MVQKSQHAEMVKGKVIRKIVFECSQRLLCKGLTGGREQQWCFYPKFVGTGKIQLPQFYCTFLFEYSQGILLLQFILDPLQCTMGDHFRPSMATHLSVSFRVSRKGVIKYLSNS